MYMFNPRRTAQLGLFATCFVLVSCLSILFVRGMDKPGVLGHEDLGSKQAPAVVNVVINR